jgi:hypothetical protein
MPWAIWLVIELDRDIMANNILMKFGDDPMKTVRLRERTLFDNCHTMSATPPTTTMSTTQPANF